MIEEDFFPATELWASPVAVNPLDAGDAILGDLFEQAFHDRGRGVIGIDQYGKVLLRVAGDVKGQSLSLVKTSP